MFSSLAKRDEVMCYVFILALGNIWFQPNWRQALAGVRVGRRAGGTWVGRRLGGGQMTGGRMACLPTCGRKALLLSLADRRKSNFLNIVIPEFR